MKTIKIILGSTLMLSFFTIDSKAQKPDSGSADSISQKTTSIIIVKEAESPTETGTHLGFRIQPTVGSFQVQNANNATIKGIAMNSYGYAASLNFYVGNFVGFHIEAIYSQLAQKYSEATIDRTIKISYINIPLLLSLNTNYGRPVNFNVAFGPQLGISTGAKLETTNNNGSVANQAVLRVKPGDVGIAYGAGLDFALGAERLFHINLGFRGVYGLVDINNSDVSTLTAGQYFILQKANVRTYAGYLGIMFKI